MNSVAVATGIAGTGVKEPWLPEGEPPMWGGGSPPSPIPVMDTPPPVTPKPNKKDSDSKKYPGGTSAMNRDLKTVADYWAETKWRGKSKKDKPKRTQAALVARAAWDRLKAHGIDPGLSRPTGSTGMVAAPKEAPRRSIGEWWSDFRNRGRGPPAQSSGKTSLEEIMG